MRIAPLALVSLLLGAPAAAATDVCAIETAERVIAIGDVHGAYEGLVAILREAQLLDDRERWIGGRALLVQTGDVLDRGPESRRALDLLRKLEPEAARAGGAVYALLGNHELMRIVGDWRYVSEGEYAEFQDDASAERRAAALQRTERALAERAAAQRQPFDSAALRSEFEQSVPLGFVEMRAAFDAGGDYGEWIRTLPAVAKVNGIAFVHGGISPTLAPLGCTAVNETIAAELAAVRYNDNSAARTGNDEAGPLWYRGLVREPEEAFAPALSAALDAFAARGVVVGHTPDPGRIVARFGGRVVAIDTGMIAGEFYPGGTPAALELRGASLTAIYLNGRREPVPAPSLFGSSSLR